jgi:hypothetical protein
MYALEEPPLVAEKEIVKLEGLATITEIDEVPGIVRGIAEMIDDDVPSPATLLACTW